MPTITLKTTIKAPVDRCFYLSLNVDLHTASSKQTNEKAVAGVTSGIMKLNDVVTWRAKHFGIYQNLTSRISAYEAPSFFVSEMVKGAFKKIHHQHILEFKNGNTIMTDIFEFKAPLWIIGNLASFLFLKRYMKKFLIIRNDTIREVAEGDGWKQLLAGIPLKPQSADSQERIHG